MPKDWMFTCQKLNTALNASYWCLHSMAISFKCHDTIRCCIHMQYLRIHETWAIYNDTANSDWNHIYKKIMQHLFSEFYIIGRIKPPQFHLLYFICIYITLSVSMVFNTIATTTVIINANFTETVCLWVGDNWCYYMQNDNAYFM